MRYHVTILTIIAAFVVSHSASAAYSVEPLKVEIESEARDIISNTITIQNGGGSPVTIYPSVNNISLSDGGTIHEFKQAVESDRSQSLSAWVEISRQGFTIPPGQSKSLPFTIRVNPAPVPGVYHAFIGFGNGRNRDEAEAMVMNGSAPGTIITVAIEEDKVEFLKLTGFVVDRFVTAKDNTAATYTFKNPGDETLIPTGEIIFYDGKGKEVAMAKVNEEKISIPPGGEHVFETRVPIDGLFGKYKAFLTVEYGNAERATVQDTSFFFVFPLTVMLIGIVLLLLIVMIFAWRIHARYFDEAEDDAERLMLHIKDTKSESQHHDIDLKKPL